MYDLAFDQNLNNFHGNDEPHWVKRKQSNTNPDIYSEMKKKIESTNTNNIGRCEQFFFFNAVNVMNAQLQIRVFFFFLVFSFLNEYD